MAGFVSKYDGPRRASHDGSTSSERTCLFEQAGDYRLTFPSFKGYASIPPRTVHVPFGKVVKVRIDLERQ